MGESGSGKTVTSMCVMGLLATPPCRVNGGEIIFQGRDLLTLSENERRQVRGKYIGMIFQEPGKYLNPAYKIGEQITETLILHFEMTRKRGRRAGFGIPESRGPGEKQACFEQLSPRTFRRHEAAGHDRHGHCLSSRPADRR